MDLDHNNEISFSEFEKTFERRIFKPKDVGDIMHETEDHLRELFNKVDADNTGNIDVYEFWDIFMKMGMNVTFE